jgi:heme exporter protein C
MSDTKPRLLTVLDILTIVVFAVAAAMVFLYAPLESTMGQVQKIFYFHTAAFWTGMLGFGCSMVAGIIYLRTHNHKWDVVELAGIEIALVFCLVGIIAGSIWAYPAWNTWWTWDPRLTTVTIMELAYFAYLMLRAGIDDPDRRARFGAVYSIVAFISVPLTFFSIRLFNTIHPVVIGSSDPGAAGTFDMTPKMVTTFMVALLAFTLVFIDLLWHRIRLGKLADKIEQKKLSLSE